MKTLKTLLVSFTLLASTVGYTQVKKISIDYAESNLPLIRLESKDLMSYTKSTKYLYALKKYVENKGFTPLQSKNDIEFIKSVMFWVTSQWEHNGWNQPPANFNALKVLKSVHNDKKQYRCVEYGLVLEELLQAYGFLSRSIGIQTTNVAYGGFGMGHVATEIWSDQLQKWVFFDPQFGVYVTKNDTPLNFYELFKSYKKDKWKNIKVIFLVKNDGDKSIKEYKKFIQSYFGYLNVRVGKTSYSLGLDANTPVITFQGMPTGYRHFTKNYMDVYPKLNKVEIKLKYSYNEPDYNLIFAPLKKITSEQDYQTFFNKNLSKFAAQPKFEIKLDDNLPHFSHYEYTTNNNEQWIKLQKNQLSWDAVKSENIFRVRAVNKFNRKGAESVVKILYQ